MHRDAVTIDCRDPDFGPSTATELSGRLSLAD
jgi:hypothetical protein